MDAAEETDEGHKYEAVFQEYLNVCNQAIERNKNIFPYTEIWGARLKLLEDEMKMQAVVYDDRPQLSCILRITRDMKIEIVEKKTPAADDAWPFSYQYLKRVVDHPKEYIENPAKLEWGWLKAIFGPVD